MSITKQDPRNIHLGGEVTEVSDLPASEVITPGFLVELVDDGGALKYQKHGSAAGDGAPSVALPQTHFNKDIDDDYAAGDTIMVAIGRPGTTFYMLIASGQDISRADKLESAGNGYLKILSGSFALFQSLDNPGSVTADTRIRVQAL